MNKKELQKYKQQQWRASDKRLGHKKYPKDLTIVAEGDSWFDYPLRKDVLDYLVQMGYAIKKFAKAGDTLENMIYGSSYSKSKGILQHKGSESLQKTLKAVKLHKPHIVLFSGGGNDVVGSEVLGYLNHAHSKPESLVNKPIFHARLKRIKIALEFMIEAIHKKNAKAQILMDGYDYPKVNGKGYRVLALRILGPWLEPSFGKKAITTKKSQKEVVVYLVDEFNEMLLSLSKKYTYFHHIDLRGKFPKESEWHNEIHLNNAGYKTVANIYHKRICQILTHDPVEVYADDIIA